MLLETKIRASNHSIVSRLCAIDSDEIEGSKNLSLEKNNKKVWAELIKKVETLKDTSAFEELFNHFAPRVKAFLMKSGADPQMAEECSQEVMATVWRKAHLFDPARASVSTWIFTIARNKKIDAIRKLNRPEPEQLYPEQDYEPDQEEVVELQQETERLATALGELPEKQRVLIEKAYLGELSHSEIAEITGLPLGTIKSRIRLALEKLRHSMM
ncbi:MAG: sigma-70 family RNA polymerase sigma factor [Rhodobacteraceae bacterium TMED160]|jgi:RNA polymerase sigma-70 factor (ECF subfamily)|nr:MAG: RNA polymerase subunit sigma [Paracoccaceae bacterium]RPF91954.1 MAG: sigma-70 family RNA polymerase sigma factor [Rhodobacteraceae bacterium TMED160]|tara:strand:+ start:3169 stop:3810 length:642 start_codon:yes stop_codon:yes gene_type:complete